MAGFDFILTFTGLCASVPNTPKKRMRVLLLDGQHSHGMSWLAVQVDRVG